MNIRLYSAIAISVIALLAISHSFSASSQETVSIRCHNIGVLTRLAAQQRDIGASPQQAHIKLEKLLKKGDSQKQQLAKKSLIMPIALAWSARDLNADNIYSLGYFICLASHNKLLQENDNVYLIHSAKLCQKRMKSRSRNHACMQLAYLLLIQDKIEKLKQNKYKVRKK